MVDARYSDSESRRIARLAKRNLDNECMLIFGASGAFFHIMFVVAYKYAPSFVMPILEHSTRHGVPLSALGISFGLSALIAVAHAKILGKRVAIAKGMDAEMKNALGRNEQLNTDVAINVMQKERAD